MIDSIPLLKGMDMRILNFGSLNIDHVYSVPHFVRPGETLAADAYSCFCGGKGCNQSIALARAGAEVLHAGKVGRDGVWLKKVLGDANAGTGLVEVSETPSGHAIIQVNAEGENSIILFGGANRMIDGALIAKAVGSMSKGDFLLLQNETNAIPEIMRAGAAAGLRIVFNPAPMGPEVKGYPLELVSCFVVNEIEGAELSGGGDTGDVLARLSARFPNAEILLTLGSKGSILACQLGVFEVAAEKVEAIDTTAAGDTFIGYFLAGRAEGLGPEASLRLATKAAAKAVTRKGAAESIPFRRELA